MTTSKNHTTSMWDSVAEAERWWLQADNDLEFARIAPLRRGTGGPLPRPGAGAG